MDNSFLNALRSGFWYCGIAGFAFGLTDRTAAALMDGYFSALDLIQLFTAAFFAISWAFLKPFQR